MNRQILRELSIDDLGHQLASGSSPSVYMVAPNFEDRSVAAAKWIQELLSPGELNAMQILWLQTPGVDDVFDRIKADNRDDLAGRFAFLGHNLKVSRLDLPNGDTEALLRNNAELAKRVGGNATLVLDISSLPRNVVRRLLGGIVRAHYRYGQRAKPFGRVVFLYTAAASYPPGADADMIGGVVGYFTGESIHDLISRAGILDATVSLAGTSHDAAQTLDALWNHGLTAHSTISATVLLNRENFVYSYQRLAHGTWAVKEAAAKNTELVYAFELGDAIRDMFERTDSAIARHRAYRDHGGLGQPTFLLGGFGPKPIGLAALLAQMRYENTMATGGYETTSDVLKITGWQYTTRYSHGEGVIKAFEVDLDALYADVESE